MGLFRGTALCTVAIWAALGCSKGTDAGSADGAERAPLGEELVSVVGTSRISVADVSRAAVIQRTQPLEALRSIQAIELLAAEATRRGYGDKQAIQRRVARASVQVLLAIEVEAVVTPESIEGRDIEAEYERDHTPEKRASRHLLVRTPDSATPSEWSRAQRVALRVLREVREGHDVGAVFERYSGTQRDGFSIVVEQLGPVTRVAGFEEPYLRALFGAEGPGVLQTLTRTSYGWHVIELTEVVPEQSLDSMAAALRARLVLQGRQRRLDELVAELMSDVDYHEDSIAQAFADDGEEHAP